MTAPIFYKYIIYLKTFLPIPLPNCSIMYIDMKCFCASFIAMLKGLDVMIVLIAVIANFKQPGSVVLATSPPMKERFHIKIGNRLLFSLNIK